MTAAKIIHLYQDECEREDENALGKRTCYRIIEVCSASKQKSLQGLDNTATAGTEAFELLESLVGQLSSNGAGAECIHVQYCQLDSIGKKQKFYATDLFYLANRKIFGRSDK